MTKAAIPRSFFTTQYLDPGQRLAGWRESISMVFDVSATSKTPVEDFNARVTSYLINNQLILSHCDTKAQRFKRSMLKVARDDLDYYLIQTHLSGSQQMHFQSGEVECRTGDLMVIDLAEKHDAITTDFTQLTLVVPRNLLSPLLIHPDSQEGRVLKANKALTHMAVCHLKNLYGTLGAMTEREAQHIVEPTLILLASALNGSSESVDGGGQAVALSLLANAKVKIEQNLKENLSVDRICTLLGYSRSNLYRLFEPMGGVRAYIQERRLHRAAAMLGSPLYTHRRICDIAYACGFASDSHFSRAFRQRFGLSPMEARLELTTMNNSRTGIELLQVGDRDYEQWLGESLRM